MNTAVVRAYIVSVHSQLGSTDNVHQNASEDNREGSRARLSAHLVEKLRLALSLDGTHQRSASNRKPNGQDY